MCDFSRISDYKYAYPNSQEKGTHLYPLSRLVYFVALMMFWISWGAWKKWDVWLIFTGLFFALVVLRYILRSGNLVVRLTRNVLCIRFISEVYRIKIRSFCGLSYRKLRIPLEEITDLYTINFKNLLGERSSETLNNLNKKLKNGSYQYLIASGESQLKETGIALRLKNGRRIALEMTDVDRFIETMAAILGKNKIKSGFDTQYNAEFFLHRWRGQHNKWSSLLLEDTFILPAMILLWGFLIFFKGFHRQNTSFYGMLLLACGGIFCIKDYIRAKSQIYQAKQFIKLTERLNINGFNLELEDIHSIRSMEVNSESWPLAFWKYREYDLIALESAGMGIVLQMKYGKPVLINISEINRLKDLLLRRMADISQNASLSEIQSASIQY